MVRLVIPLLSTCAVVTQGVLQDKLSDWIFSSKGLDQSRADADRLAKLEYGKLSRGRYTVDMLQALKDVMYSTSNMDFQKSEVAANIFPLAESHVAADKLLAIYKTLYSTSGADMDKKTAQAKAMELATRGGNGIDSAGMGALWKVLYGISGVNLDKSNAQHWVFQLALAGVDSAALQTAFKTYYRTKSKEEAFKAAVSDAVNSNLAGLPQRVAKDGKAYTAKGFQDYYGDDWVNQWNSSPEQRRVAQDGNRYTALEFKGYYGDAWTSKWAASQVAQEKRLAADGHAYTMQEFQQYYKDTWQTEWFKSSEIADDCAFLNHDGCDAAAAQCQWKWTQDWTDSCILKTKTAAYMV